MLATIKVKDLNYKNTLIKNIASIVNGREFEAYVLNSEENLECNTTSTDYKIDAGNNWWLTITETESTNELIVNLRYRYTSNLTRFKGVEPAQAVFIMLTIKGWSITY